MKERLDLVRVLAAMVVFVSAQAIAEQGSEVRAANRYNFTMKYLNVD